jgi:hypothetical protein
MVKGGHELAVAAASSAEAHGRVAARANGGGGCGVVRGEWAV